MSQLLDVPGVCSLSTGASTLQLHIDVADGRQLLRDHGSAVLRGALVRRGRAADLIGIGWGSVYAITDRMREFLQGSGLTGWYARAINIEPDPTFGGPLWILGVSGVSGPTYSSARNALPGLPRFGEFLDPADWDGSDFFCPANARRFLITAHAATLLAAARLRNLSIECGSLEALPARMT